MGRYNWTRIRNTCPEFVLNEWDIVLAVIAAFGFVLSCFLVRRFKNELKGSVFLFTLALIDMAYCLLYEYNYFLKSFNIHVECDLMAQIRVRVMPQVKMIEEFGNIFVPLLVFYIIFEKFLWTCTSRTRHTYRLFTVDTHKYTLTVVTAFYAIVAMIFVTWNTKIAHIHFCDVLLLPLTWKQPAFRFLQRVAIPMVSLVLTPITFILALVTLCRYCRVGDGEKPVRQEEDSKDTKMFITTGRVKRSILCMLAIYFLFMVRGFCWYVYINPGTASIVAERRNSRIMRSWSYDFMNVVFSGSRLILYFVFCRNELVVDFPPNAIRD